MNSSHQPLEMIQGEQVLRRPARALIAWMSELEGIAALSGHNPAPGEDVQSIRCEIAQARRATDDLPRYEPNDPLVVSDSQRLRGVKGRPEVGASFAGMNWRPEVVDLRKVLSFQKVIHVDGLDERLVDVKDEDALFELCIPSSQPVPPSGAFTDPDGKGFTISSFNPNLRIAGGQLTDANVSPGPQLPPVRMQAVTLFVSLGSSYIQVVRYRNRCFIRDGYRRAAGLLRRGIYQVPCIFIEAETFEQLGGVPGAFSYEVLYSDRPPLAHDFWNDAVARDVTQAAVRKVVRIRGEEFVVPR